MKLISLCTFILVSAAVAFAVSSASAQGLPSGGGLEGLGGVSHNTAEDRANSLIPGPPKRGKEKMEQADAKALPTKKVVDPKFQGSLLDVGLPSTASNKPKIDSDKDSKPEKTADTSSDKQKAVKSTDAAGDPHTKDQKATEPDKKTSESSADKTSASKADGDH